MSVEVRAPGKVVLLGEYAVLRGAPALVAAVDRHACVRLDASADQCFWIFSPLLGAPVSLRMDAGASVQFSEAAAPPDAAKIGWARASIQVVLEALQAAGRTAPPARIDVDSSELGVSSSGDKAGLGSSAAVTVALCRALLEWGGVAAVGPEGRKRVFNLALRAHREAQGLGGSGVDVAASTYGGVIEYRAPISSDSALATVIPRRMPAGLHWLCVGTGRSASTPELVAKVLAARAQNSVVVDPLFDQLALLARTGCEALAAADTATFAEVFGRYHETLGRLGEACDADIVSREHQRAAEIVKRAGGAYKPSGAGGGDLGVALTTSAVALERVEAMLRLSGFELSRLRLAPEWPGRLAR